MAKKFDCVAMKDRIQKRLLKQSEGLSSAERIARMRETLDRSASPIGTLWRALRADSRAEVSRVAESGGDYEIAGTAGSKRKTNACG